MRTLMGVENVDLGQAGEVEGVDVEERLARHSCPLVIELRDAVGEEAEVALFRGVEGVQSVGVRFLHVPWGADAAEWCG